MTRTTPTTRGRSYKPNFHEHIYRNIFTDDRTAKRRSITATSVKPGSLSARQRRTTFNFSAELISPIDAPRRVPRIICLLRRRRDEVAGAIVRRRQLIAIGVRIRKMQIVQRRRVAGVHAVLLDVCGVRRGAALDAAAARAVQAGPGVLHPLRDVEHRAGRRAGARLVRVRDVAQQRGQRGQVRAHDRSRDFDGRPDGVCGSLAGCDEGGGLGLELQGLHEPDDGAG